MIRTRTAVTPERIAKHDWWWRRPQKGLTIDDKGRFKAIEGDPHGYLWKDGNEAAAHAYELSRRLDPKLPRWMALSPAAVSELLRRLKERTTFDVARFGGVFATIITPRKGGVHITGKVEDKGHCIVATARGQDEPGYTEFVQFNLAARDSALKKFFLKFIAEQRELKKVELAKLPRKNAFSWRWFEVWDLNEKDGVPLDGSEHKMKSKARKEAEKVLPIVREAIDHAKKSEKSFVKKTQ